MGSIGGALAAAIMMGTIESVVDIWSPTWSVAVSLPGTRARADLPAQGLFGQREARAQ